MAVGNWYDWGYGGMMGLGGGLMVVFMIAFWIAVIVLVWWLIKQTVRPGAGGSEKETAREILDKRYARGDLGKKEYDEMKRALEK
ncbi:MAG: hypothetical protein WC792_04015 [Candidatus Micrarchaeia archaeon]|jgi:putative membrane protein